MTFDLCCFYLGCDLLRAPNFKWQRLRIEDQLSCLLDVLVANDRFDGCIRIVNQ
jgi:hypothetical protein